MIEGQPIGVDTTKTNATRINAESHERKIGGFDNWYITDHPDDKRETREHLHRAYGSLKELGIRSIRYDWRWSSIQPNEGPMDTAQLEHYKMAREVMNDVGLEAPTIVLSSPPDWAVNLYKSGDKQGFYDAYEKYVQEVKAWLDRAGGEPVTRVQVLNELNNKVFTPVKTEDIGELCDRTRNIFGSDTKIIGTVFAGNVLYGTPIRRYLNKYADVLRNNFDVIGVDYYPSTWNEPIAEATGEALQKFARNAQLLARRKMRPPETHSFLKSVARNMTLLRKVYDRISQWEGVDYELGEMGRSTKTFLGGEETQKVFFEAFLEGYRDMVSDMETNGQKLPSAMGIYELRDEPAETLLKYIPGFNMQHWGIYTSDLKPKLVTQTLLAED